KVDFFGGVKLLVESADRAERRGLTEEERTRGPAHAPAECVPQADPGPDPERYAWQRDRTAAADGCFCFDHFDNVLEQLPRGRGIRVDEDQPVARGRGGARVACAGDLVQWLEHHVRAGSASNRGGAVG